MSDFETADAAKRAKKMFIWTYVCIAIVVFVVLLTVFCVRFFALKLPLIEDAWWEEILKYFVAYIAITVICCVLAYTPAMFIILRKVHGISGKKK